MTLGTRARHWTLASLLFACSTCRPFESHPTTITFAYELVGLVRAHLEAENATVFRVLDATQEADERNERMKHQP